MSEGNNDSSRNILIRTPSETSESGTQTDSFLYPQGQNNMESSQQGMSIRKRRNLSKNRGQATKNREKTPEPGRTLLPHEDTTTSDDEDPTPKYRSSREIEADNTYEEMKRLVQEKAGDKDPVYDIDTEEILERRVIAANDRRRRSVSPFALPTDKEEMCKLERKGSWSDPTNKLLSTTYSLSPKDEDKGRRPSLTIEPPNMARKNSLTSLTTPSTTSPRDKLDFQYPPKKLEPIVYPDEKHTVDTINSTPVSNQMFEFENMTEFLERKRSITPKIDAQTPTQGEIVTKVIQIERTPSKKLLPESKPSVEVRQRVVRTPSRKFSEGKPTNVIVRQPKPPSEEAPKLPPVKPARSRSASRFGGKTSESEMSEDQGRVPTAAEVTPRRQVIPTPRRFLRKKSPRPNRSQSVSRVEDLKVEDKSNTEITKTGKEIVALMQQAKAKSVPKDETNKPSTYKKYSKILMTPNKTPNKTPPSVSRSSRGISCPKTIQIISGKEILGDLVPTKPKVEKPSRKSNKHNNSGYIEASQSEYTSSYSTSPSDTEYSTFDLAAKTDELARKLTLLSKEDLFNAEGNILFVKDDTIASEPKSVLRKRNVGSASEEPKTKNKTFVKEKMESEARKKPVARSRFRIISNWRQFKQENQTAYNIMIAQRNRCICDLILLIFFCGLGGMMFRTLEGGFENAFKCSTRNVKRDFIENLWRGSHYMREEDWKSMARKKLYEFEDQLHTAHEAGVTSYSGQRSWNFMNSFVYCMTLITTIGYGHIAPKTTYGRIATIAYAIVGIPLFLIVLADFGKLFTRIIKFFWSFVRRFYYTKSCKKVRRTVPMQEVMKGFNMVYDVVRRPSQIFNEEDMTAAHPEGHAPPALRRPSDGPPPLPPKPGTLPRDFNPDDLEPETPAPSVYEIDDEFNLPISVAIVILVIYIIIGAIVYHMWETWNFFESFYFVFISMSTIGLGDLVPDHPMFMMASILYLVFGLALTSMCINVVQVKLSDTFKQASAKIGATIGLKVAEEDGSLVPITPPPMEIAPVHQKKAEKEEGES